VRKFSSCEFFEKFGGKKIMVTFAVPSHF